MTRAIKGTRAALKYLAWLVASALSCLTATSTERQSLSGRGDPSPRNSGSPSASHKWTCRRIRTQILNICPNICSLHEYLFAIFSQIHKLSRTFTAHLSKLPLPQLLPEDQLLPWELGGGDVLPGERVHGEGGDGVHVAAGDALQPHDVRLSVVWRVAMETLVGCALGDVGLSVASSTRWWRDDIVCLLFSFCTRQEIKTIQYTVHAVLSLSLLSTVADVWMSDVTPLSSYHATTLMPCDRKSAEGGHREDCRGGELEKEEEEIWTEGKLQNERACFIIKKI